MADKLAGVVKGMQRGHGGEARRNGTNHDLMLLLQMSDNDSGSGSYEDVMCSLPLVMEETSLADP